MAAWRTEHMDGICFTCPHCGQTLEAPPDMAGQTADCPGCDKVVSIPGLSPSVPPPSVERPDPPPKRRTMPILFRCPQCNHLIEADPGMADMCMDCPKCLSVVTVPDRTAAGTPPSADGSEGGRVSHSCPACRSASTRRCEVAYLDGTKSGSIVGFGLDSSADGLDVVPAVGFSQTRTALAEAIAPPPEPTFSFGKAKQEWERQMDRWRRKWVCQQCGHCWTPR